MRLYRKIIPKIAREIIKTLHSKGQIEVEDGKMDEAELDLAAALVEYMNEEERIVADARETLQRRGLPPERFSQIKKSLADARNFKIGDEGLDELLRQLLEILFSSPNIAEVYAEDHEIRKFMRTVFDKHTSIDEDIDREARARLKNIKEGTQEWEIEYPRAVAQIRRQKGIV